MKNTFIAKIYNHVLDTRRATESSEDLPEEVIKDEFRIDYQPGDPNSASRAIDHIIEKIIKTNEDFPRYATKLGFEWESREVELIVTREDQTVISNLIINGGKEVDLFEKIYKFLKENFYFI